jgi:hypothetical protein
MEMRSVSAEAVALVGGLLFLLIAVVGGGFTAKEVAIPGVPGWGRIASLVVGVALVVPYFSDALRSNAAPLPEPRIAASIDDSAATSGSAVHDARDRTDVSRDGLEVSGLLATADGSQPAVGDSIEVEFTLRNAGADAISLADAFVGVRTPGDENGDFANADDAIVLQPGETITVGGSRVFDAEGLWTLFPCYQLATGRYCPDEWRAFQVLVQG